ncbi:MAG TPA: 16S rRNA (cytosine(1402)-N(4))-methyltransferase RsmH [Frankiaceae bacterium]|jgi:16S rRNA (cytosine1402-N4)-methyltransferase|nr:16S rRNA (cytosine(1402)-N(4))-methyltransferase RsmH [Frankiaceae bacterium]
MDPNEPAAFAHAPVLADRIVELLTPALQAPASVFADLTLGLGGHTEALLDAAPNALAVGIDRDTEAIERARARLAGYGSRVRFAHAVYDEIPGVLEGFGLGPISAVLLDLGVSSLQLDDGKRGFSYSRDAPLDMRMDQSRGLTAADVVNGYETGELARVLRTYGEERFARRIAESIVRDRAVAPFTNTARLAELVRESVPAATRRTGGHPAKRTFQALRIEVNDELRALESAVPAAIGALAPGGRIAVLAYQSLEDRIVKRALTAGAHPERDSDLPPDFPVPPPAPALRLLTRGAERPTDDEIAANPRAASARLRAAERLDAELPSALQKPFSVNATSTPSKTGRRGRS